MPNKIRLLCETCMNQASQLLIQFDEFYPFAFGLDNDLQIIPISSFNGNENPTSKEVLLMLESAIQSKVDRNELTSVAICLDVRLIPPYLDQKIDSLEIRLDFNDEENINVYIPYKLNQKNGIEYFQVFQKTGSLELFKNKHTGDESSVGASVPPSGQH